MPTMNRFALAEGYDHNYVLKVRGLGLGAPRVRFIGTGRVMEVHTTQPGMQFYTGNHLPDKLEGKMAPSMAFARASVLRHSIFRIARISPHFPVRF